MPKPKVLSEADEFERKLRRGQRRKNILLGALVGATLAGGAAAGGAAFRELASRPTRLPPPISAPQSEKRDGGVQEKRDAGQQRPDAGASDAGVRGVAVRDGGAPQQAAGGLFSGLNQKLQAKIAGLKRESKLGSDDQVSVVVHGLNSGREYANINGDQQASAASLIKPFVMLAAYHKIACGALVPRWFETNVRKMIAASENRNTNALMEFVGGPAEVERIAHHYGFTGTRVVEYIPEDGRTYGNRTTAGDLNRLLALLHGQKLVTPFYSARMMKHLDTYETPKGRYPGSRILQQARAHSLQLAGKTGFVNGLNGEAARISFRVGRNKYAYTFVVIISNPLVQNATNGKEWGRRTAEAIRDIFREVHSHVSAPLLASK